MAKQAVVRSTCCTFRMVGIFCLAVVFSVGIVDGRLLIVNQRHPRASDQNDGTAEAPFLTINRAAQLANPGDTVLVRAGTYRERVSPARGGRADAYITYMAAPGDTVYIKGSEVWEPEWKNVQANVYAAKPDNALFGSYNPYRMRLAGGMGHTLGQVFVNGRLMKEVTSRSFCLATPSSWWCDSLSDTIFVHFPQGISPAQALVELTVRSRVFAPHIRGLAYLRVKGFMMEHCANQNPAAFDAIAANAQAGLLGCRSGNNWIIENNVVRYAKTIGIDFGNEGGLDNEGSQRTPAGVGYHIIRGNIISHHGTCGICGMGARSTYIVNNIIEYNNEMEIDIVENSGFKAHNFNGGVIEGNIVRYNKSYGIWLDAHWPNARVSRNLIYGNKDCGMFFELAAGPAVFDNNIVVYNRQAGVFLRDAANVTIVHNLIHRNATFGIYLQAPDGRSIGGGPANVVNNKIFNNIIYRNTAMEVKADADPGVANNTAGCNVFLHGKTYRIDTTLVAIDTLIDSIRADTGAAMTIRIAARNAFFAMACTTFSGITQDYRGNPFPSKHPLAGPFQGLKEGLNDISITIDGIPSVPTRVRNGTFSDAKALSFTIGRRAKRFVIDKKERGNIFGVAPGLVLFTIHGRLIRPIEWARDGDKGKMPLDLQPGIVVMTENP